MSNAQHTALDTSKYNFYSQKLIKCSKISRKITLGPLFILILLELKLMNLHVIPQVLPIQSVLRIFFNHFLAYRKKVLFKIVFKLVKLDQFRQHWTIWTKQNWTIWMTTFDDLDESSLICQNTYHKGQQHP